MEMRGVVRLLPVVFCFFLMAFGVDANARSQANGQTQEELARREVQLVREHEAKPLDIGVAVRLAEVRAQLKKFPEAVAVLREVRQKNPKDEKVFAALADVLEKSGDRYEARVIYLDWIKAFGKTPRVVSKLCRSYAEDGFLKEAKDYCLQALKLDPQEPLNDLYLSRTSFNAGDKKLAQTQLKEGISKHPRSALLYSELGQRLVEEKNWESAFKYFETAFRLDSKNEDVALDFGKTAFQLGRHQQALEAFKRALQLDKAKAVTEVRRSAGILRSRKDSAESEKYQALLTEFGY